MIGESRAGGSTDVLQEQRQELLVTETVLRPRRLEGPIDSFPGIEVYIVVARVHYSTSCLAKDGAEIAFFQNIFAGGQAGF
jgi:hypothetical protein